MENTEMNKTWHKHVADDVLAIAVAIMVQGKDKHKIKIGIDAAVQAAGMAYCSERARHYWGEELKPKGIQMLESVGKKRG